MLIRELTVDHVYLACGHTDMRKSIDGLAAIVQQNFKLDVFSGSLFLFCGKRCDRIKALLWEEDGFVLLYKRLENGKYKWPRDSNEAKQITQQEFRWLMEGLSIEQKTAIDLFVNLVLCEIFLKIIVISYNQRNFLTAKNRFLQMKFKVKLKNPKN